MLTTMPRINNHVEMTLIYKVIMEGDPFMNRVVGSSIPAIKSSLYLMGKTR
jgi:hypothetical protein